MKVTEIEDLDLYRKDHQIQIIDFWPANPGCLVSRACNGAESGSVHIIHYTAK